MLTRIACEKRTHTSVTDRPGRSESETDHLVGGCQLAGAQVVRERLDSVEYLFLERQLPVILGDVERRPDLARGDRTRQELRRVCNDGVVWSPRTRSACEACQCCMEVGESRVGDG